MDDPKMTIEVGGDLRSVAASVAAKWKAAAAGKPVEPSNRLVFCDWAALYATLTPKRMELMAWLVKSPAEGIRALARSLDRDVKRVHSDVVALEEIGLLSRDEAGRVTATMAEISTVIRFGPASDDDYPGSTSARAAIAGSEKRA